MVPCGECKRPLDASPDGYRGYIEVFKTEAEARAAIEAWVRGLEIVPWHENGNSEVED